mmetsp:Transcript_28779/g.48336  ORF Transcript_28779/g.48336 Transcript_28779/m.48336 type:complete len:85 (-) Transcript_28779:325-579(-)
MEDTTSAAFKALLKYLFYTDNMDEVDHTVLCDLAKLSDQYRVEWLFNHCLHQLFNKGTVPSRMQSYGWCRRTLPVVRADPCGAD